MESEPRNLYEKLLREVPYKTANFDYIGKNMPRFDARVKVRGEAVFTTDIVLPGMLYGKVLRSPYAHARIKSINTEKAASLSGVRAILTINDAEVQDVEAGELVCPWDFGWPGPEWEEAVRAEPLLAVEVWRAWEQCGACVAADSPDIAEEALRLIEVKWEELPFNLEMSEAIGGKKTGPWTNNIMVESRKEKGDVEAGFREAEIIIEGSGRWAPIPAMSIETKASVANWEHDELTLYFRGQQVRPSLKKYARALKMPASKVRVVSPYQGGSFGQMFTAGIEDTRTDLIAAILARKTGRPVKIVMTRHENLFGTDWEMIFNYRIGAKKDGTITAWEVKDRVSGCVGGSSTLQAFGLPGNWARDELKCENNVEETTVVFVNRQPTWWNRSEQNEPAVVLHTIISQVADRLGMDPCDVYLKNIKVPGPSAQAVVAKVQEASDWKVKLHPAGTKTLANGKKHGIGIVLSHSWGNYTDFNVQVGLKIEGDGSCTIIGLKDDIGVTSHTTYAAIVADEMGLKFDEVHFPVVQSTDVGYMLQGGGGAASLHGNAFACIKLARKARQELLELVAPKFGEGVKPDDLDMRFSKVFRKNAPEDTRDLKDLLFSNIDGNSPDQTLTVGARVEGRGWPEENIFEIYTPYQCYQAHVAEVEVDIETGEIEVTRLTNVADVGKMIRPETVHGQLYGGDIMGIERAKTQDTIYDPTTGVILNASWVYGEVGVMSDINEVETHGLEVGHNPGPYGLVGVGESTANLVFLAVQSAVQNAIGEWIEKFPLTPDKVLAAVSMASEGVTA